jgi:hypothetical protein
MANRSIVLSGQKNVDGVVWSAGTYPLTDDGWSEKLLIQAASVATEPTAPSPTYIKGLGWQMGKVKLTSERSISRSIVVASPLNVHGVKWPAGTFVFKDDGHAELLLAAGATEPSAPTPVHINGRGWILQ